MRSNVPPLSGIAEPNFLVIVNSYWQPFSQLSELLAENAGYREHEYESQRYTMVAMLAAAPILAVLETEGQPKVRRTRCNRHEHRFRK
jgi:hypothetical protein